MIPLVVGLFIGTIFVTVFVAAFHDPKPHHLPVAVVAPPPVITALQAQSKSNGDAIGSSLPATAEPRRHRRRRDDDGRPGL